MVQDVHLNYLTLRPDPDSTVICRKPLYMQDCPVSLSRRGLVQGGSWNAYSVAVGERSDNQGVLLLDTVRCTVCSVPYCARTGASEVEKSCAE
jgi:hypothetical protein